MNEEFGKDLKQSRHGQVGYCFGVFLEETKKTMKKLGQDSRYLGPDSKREPLQYKYRPLPLRQPARSWNHDNTVASKDYAAHGPRSKQRDGGRCCATAW
jgi:hypothetical protein